MCDMRKEVLSPEEVVVGQVRVKKGAFFTRITVVEEGVIYVHVFDGRKRFYRRFFKELF